MFLLIGSNCDEISRDFTIIYALSVGNRIRKACGNSVSCDLEDCARLRNEPQRIQPATATALIDWFNTALHTV
jgi:hypothetical protein